ncbi:ECF RNA polymerase sigma factor SigW [bioreactor metagenome]|jgi:RNA polymerase sigma-70 factor (ECF subfamily)|uniref:ECF RNA polymerase sigma factor SigW n=1 Tax=bioreactor metagenome TaxID=1076179 RepID=A0A644VWS5_9ZZZZ|nr:sigma-70 family RNA polymerase sigma factor [Paludibacter sp.]
MAVLEEDILSQLVNPKTNAQAFSKLVHLYQERLYWHIRKMVLSHEDANDVLQNTFMKAWNGLAGFRGESQISTWLYRIATNETLTFLANKRMRNISGIDDVEGLLLGQLQADSYFSGNEAEMKLQEAILTLPEKQRLVFNMKYFDDLTYEEMENILETSAGALKASYHHAVKKIEKYLSEERTAKAIIRADELL